MKLIIALVVLGVAYEAQSGFLDGISKAANNFFNGATDAGDRIQNAVDTLTPQGVLQGCERDVSLESRRSLYEFATKLYKRVAQETGNHFVISQFSVWLALAAIAETLNGEAQLSVFKALSFPEMPCLREKYYQQVMGLETVGNDVMFTRKRMLVLDPSVQVNPSWIERIKSYGIFEPYTTPLLSNPLESANALRSMFGLRLPSLPQGGSIYMDCLDFSGLWQTAFSDADIERNAPFYNDAGEMIGRMDFMRMRKRVRVAYYPLLDAKVLELPIGSDGRYSLLLLINMGLKSIQSAMSVFTNTIIMDIMDNMIQSLIPIEIAVPKISLNSELDLTKALQDIGVGGWNDGRTLSPLPVAVIQRVSINLDSRGAQPLQTNFILSAFANLATGLSSAVGRDFIANRPMMFGIIDAKTRSPLLTGAYSRPQVVQ